MTGWLATQIAEPNPSMPTFTSTTAHGSTSDKLQHGDSYSPDEVFFLPLIPIIYISDTLGVALTQNSQTKAHFFSFWSSPTGSNYASKSMISSRKLAQMARKWLRVTTAGRKRITLRRGGEANTMAVDTEAAPIAGKGRFVVYCNDGQRFEVPLAYLKSDIFGELLRMSEDLFGLPGAGHITLPCDAASWAASSHASGGDRRGT